MIFHFLQVLQQPHGGAGQVEQEQVYENQDAYEDEAKRGGGGITAVALYDYQAMADDEISFDPNDVISNIEMVSLFLSMIYRFRVEVKM